MFFPTSVVVSFFSFLFLLTVVIVLFYNVLVTAPVESDQLFTFLFALGGKLSEKPEADTAEFH